MIEYHPLANKLPLIEGEDFERLKASIRENGLIHPIITHNGKILDGRNRYRACLATGVEPKFVDFGGDELQMVNMVEALNLDRRHLTDTQRALIAAELSVSKRLHPDQARAAMNAPDGLTSRAETLIRHGSPKVVELVREGKTTISRAHKVVTGRLKPHQILPPVRPGGAPSKGRPIGDTRLNKFIRLAKGMAEMYEVRDLVLKSWRGHPDEAAALKDARKLLTYLEARLVSKNEMVEDSYVGGPDYDQTTGT
jgi:hypothetical protein